MNGEKKRINGENSDTKKVTKKILFTGNGTENNYAILNMSHAND